MSIRHLFRALTEELFEKTTSCSLTSNKWVGCGRGNASAEVFGPVEMPFSLMLAGHEDAGELLAEMRALSTECQAPNSACPTHHGQYHGLEESEREMYHHVHLENSILFPRALHLEQRGRRTGP